MTLSAWSFVDILTSVEASLIYYGADPDIFETRRNYPDDYFPDQEKMHMRMVAAAQKGELKPCGVEVAKRNEKGEVDRNLTTGIFDWDILSDDDLSWKDYPPNLVRFWLDRQELYRWLLTIVSHSNIPEELHVQPGYKKNELLSLLKTDEVNEPKQYVLKRDRQDKAILDTLLEMGYEPTEYPKAEAGHSGVKADVREKLLLNRRDLFTEKSFKNSWQRLRNKGLICEK